MGTLTFTQPDLIISPESSLVEETGRAVLASPSQGGENAVVGGSASPFTCLIGYEFQKKQSLGSSLSVRHKKARFFVRAFLGVSVAVAKGYRLRWFTFTESDSALLHHLDFGKAQNGFWNRLRYHCPDVQYSVIEHCQGKPSVITGLPRRNWHCLTYGSDKLPVDKCREFWQSGYESAISGMQEVRSPERAIFYLVKYLEEGEKFIRAWTSHNWVYDGWVGQSKQFKRAFGYYPPRAELVRLARLSKRERELDSVYLVMRGLVPERKPLSVPVWVLSKLNDYLGCDAAGREGHTDGSRFNVRTSSCSV